MVKFDINEHFLGKLEYLTFKRSPKENKRPIVNPTPAPIQPWRNGMQNIFNPNKFQHMPISLKETAAAALTNSSITISNYIFTILEMLVVTYTPFILDI